MFLFLPFTIVILNRILLNFKIMGTIKIPDIRLNSRMVHCFMCFESFEREDSNNDKPLPSLFSLSQYLGVKLANMDFNKSEENGNLPLLSHSLQQRSPSELRARLCAECLKANSKFEELVRLQEKVRLELNYWLERIHTRFDARVATSGQDDAQKLRELEGSLNLRTNPEISQRLRETLKQKCESKLLIQKAELTPRVKLQKLSPAEMPPNPTSSPSAPYVETSQIVKMEVEKPPAILRPILSLLQPSAVEQGEACSVEVKYETEFSNSSSENLESDSLYRGDESVPPNPNPPQTAPTLACSLCEKSFKTSAQLRSHHEIEHLGIRYRCNQCLKSFTTRRGVKYHKLMVPFCEKNKNGSTKQGRRRERGTFNCHICNKSFNWQTHLDRHVNLVHLKKKEHPCQICKKLFSSKSHLERHFRNVHLGMKFNCEAFGCDKVYSTKYNLDLHMKRVHVNIMTV